MRFIADLHLHSRHSRATSQEMRIKRLAEWARLKGIRVLGTGDFTHPVYFAELRSQLEERAPGLFAARGGTDDALFILSVEVSNVFSHGGQTRKIHTLILAPSLETAERLNTRLAPRGKLASDGRPTFGFPVRDLLRLILDVAPDCFVVPAHIWTPWFSLFGANSGFDSLEEAFGPDGTAIRAVETGLSSDPAMNWRLSALDDLALISNSDAHSLTKLGREANVFDCELSYKGVVEAITSKDPDQFLFTIEFFPEEGKYHYNGHRACGVLQSPQETLAQGTTDCPVCGRKLTLGVLHRVEELADRPPGYVPPGAVPARHLVPLQEIVAEAMGQGVNTKGVEDEYLRLCREGGGEFPVLLDRDLADLGRLTSPRIVEGIRRVRAGELEIVPGYDGVFGQISLFPDQADEARAEQMGLF